jgi:hypothetical protein
MHADQDVAILRLLVLVDGDLRTLDAAWGDRWASYQARRMMLRGLCGSCRKGHLWPTGAGWSMIHYDDKLTPEPEVEHAQA